ncbi:SpoIID/LytB domain-containing protein [Tindallia californiensis]|uniref:SpoIID/LytB domain protein n=1 Tax=Tindallia californiensis TaxID=159292 RepID=A0A1H3N8L1_9FIRM|nr:SpoIID/LytB domain-containing protein [Tindallia californiensis]SDY85281.1 SpoIID/LytB domain protein [Tindallia californiensis]
MKKNKFITFEKALLTCFFLILLMASQGMKVYAQLEVGDKTGEVLSTDIIASINNKHIPSFNYNGYTAVIVEDLRSYGFDVRWIPAKRMLSIERDFQNNIVGKEASTDNNTSPGLKLYDVLYTDIQTYINGEKVESYNIDGQTVIYFNALSEVGNIEWNQDARMASLYLEDTDQKVAKSEESNEEIAKAEIEQINSENSTRRSTNTPVTRQKTRVDPDARFLQKGNYHPSMIPHNIKIGLYFGETAVSSISIESDSGFQMGMFANDNFKDVLTLNDAKNITISQESYYYVGLETSFSSLNQMNEEMKRMRKYTDENLVYARVTDGWNIYMGPFHSKTESANAVKDLGHTDETKWKIIEPSNKYIAISASNQPFIIYDKNEPIYLASAGQDYTNSIIKIGSKKYRGAVTALIDNNNRLSIINVLPMEKYLYGVVPREVPHSWPEEALKAQAVAARGFAVASLNKYESLGFHLCSTVNSQVYGGYEAEQQRTNHAVDATRGQIITYNGHLAIPYYHSTSGGHTEDSENIWTNAVPYVRGVSDQYSYSSPHTNWEKTISGEEARDLLKNHNIMIGELEHMYVAEISSNGRVLSFMVEGSLGHSELIKQESRNVFGLRSSWFQLEYDTKNDIYYFEGKGFGHGIGMSQYGAKGMAEAGYRYDDILKHYFTGVSIQ